jgi:hypothetical protein
MAAPKAPKNRWSDKAWRDAIRVAVNRVEEDGGKKLAKLADALVTAGLDGDVPALKEIGDRLDGKVPQAHVGGGEEDNPIRFEAVNLIPVRPKHDA